MEKYLGIDWGEKRIGLAISEPGTSLALPFKTVSNLNEVLAVVAEEEVTAIVLGVPFKMSHPDHDLNPHFNRFADTLAEQIKIPIYQVDERLSSLAADALGGTSKTKAGRDELAATLILQTYLDKEASA